MSQVDETDAPEGYRAILMGYNGCFDCALVGTDYSVVCRGAKCMPDPRDDGQAVGFHRMSKAAARQQRKPPVDT